MTFENPFLPLTRSNMNILITAPQKQGLFLNFVRDFFNQWIHYESDYKRLITQGMPIPPDLQGDQEIKVSLDEEGKGYVGSDDLAMIAENYIKSRLQELKKYEKQNLLDFCKRLQNQLMMILHIIDALMRSLPNSKADYQFWGGTSAIFRKTLTIPGFSMTLHEQIIAKLSSFHRVYHTLLNSLNELSPQFLRFDLNEEGPEINWRQFKGDEIEFIKSTTLRLATNEMRNYEGIEAEFQVTQNSRPKQPIWAKLDAPRLVVASIIGAVVVGALILGLNFIPVVGQAFSVLLAMSFVNSIVVTSLVGFGVAGLVAFGVALTHITLAAKKYYQPEPKLQAWNFHIQALPHTCPQQRSQETDEIRRESIRCLPVLVDSDSETPGPSADSDSQSSISQPTSTSVTPRDSESFSPRF